MSVDESPITSFRRCQAQRRYTQSRGVEVSSEDGRAVTGAIFLDRDRTRYGNESSCSQFERLVYSCGHIGCVRLIIETDRLGALPRAVM